MKSSSIKTKKRNNLIFYVCLLIWPLAQFSVFYVGVHTNSILLAFKTSSRLATGAIVYKWSGFGNFKDIWYTIVNSPAIRISLKNSAIHFAVVNLFAWSIQHFVPYYIYKKKFGHRVFKIILFLPSVISSVVIVSLFKYFVDGVIPDALNSIFGTKYGGFIWGKNSFWWILFYGIWHGFGGGMLMMVGTMSRISESIVESAQIDGANLLQEYFRITLPMIWPTFSVFTVVSISGFFTNQMDLFTFFDSRAPSDSWVVGYYFFRELNTQGQNRYPYLAAMGLVMTAVAAPLTFLTRYLLNKLGPST